VAPNLDSNDTNDDPDVFVHNCLTRSTTVVSVNPSGNTGPTGGATGDRASRYVSVSEDGRYIAFHSNADDLDVDDTNTQADAFVRDTWAGTTQLVSLDWQGSATQIAGIIDIGSITEDGRYLTFYSEGNEYVAPGRDNNGFWDVFLIDRDTDGNGVMDEAGNVANRRVSLGPKGEEGNDESVTTSLMAGISGNANFIVFESLATNFTGPLVGDSNSSSDVFVREIWKPMRR
jgi:Tol biopolymer transport system component